MLPDGAVREAVAIFRNPKQRLLSSYYWKLAHKGCCKGDWGWSEKEMAEVEAKLGRKAGPTETLGNFTSCQTRMVLGGGCFALQPALTDADIESAMDRVTKFRFVGIIEEWHLSVCLLNHIMTGERIVFANQLENNRPTKGSGGARTYEVPLDLPEDKADRRLYAAVMACFKGEVNERNISLESCTLKCLAP